MGYCGNMCRPFSIGMPSKKEFRLMNIGKEAIDYAVSAIKPGIKASDVFNGYYKILSKYNLEEFALSTMSSQTLFSIILKRIRRKYLSAGMSINH